MIHTFLLILLCCFGILGNTRGVENNRRSCQDVQTPERRRCHVCQRAPRDVTLRIRNVLKKPFFQEEIKINCTRYETLFYIMQQAAEANAAFQFNVIYFKRFGFFVNEINNVGGSYFLDGTFWEILDRNLTLTPGVSSYIPPHGEIITFNLTTSSHHG